MRVRITLMTAWSHKCLFSFRTIWIEAIFTFLKAYFSCHSAPSFNARRMSVKCIRACVCDCKYTLLNSSGFYDNTEKVKMRMTWSHKNYTPEVSPSGGLYNVTYTNCSATFPSRDRDQDRLIRAGWLYNQQWRGKLPLCFTKIIQTHLQYNYQFQKWSQFSSVHR